MAHLGELLAELRQDRGLTQDQLAEIISVSPGTISNYEHGRHLPDLDKLKMIADYFHVTTDYLLGRTSSSIPIDLLQKSSPMGKQSLISSASFSGSLQTVNMRCCSSFRIWIFSIL